MAEANALRAKDAREDRYQASCTVRETVE